MILEAYMPVYIGVKIFIAYGCTGGRAGPPEVVQEALADLKRHLIIFLQSLRWRLMTV